MSMDSGNDVYLDHNATTSVRPQVIEAVCQVMEVTGNPSSVHKAGRDARRFLEDARDSIGLLAGAAPAGVIFTSGGTEANNLAIRGSGRSRILVSAIEHAAALKASEDIEVIPAGADGIVDLNALREMLAADERPAVVSVMAANNETGVLQPIEQVSQLAHQFGALFHCDAVQAVGKIPLSMTASGIDMLTLSAHKIGGPTGVGALVIRGDIQLQALNRGGGQERSRRGGTENLSGIVGFGVAADLALAEIGQYKHVSDWRDRIEAETGAVVIGGQVPRLGNTSCLSMPGVTSDTQVMAFDLAGISISAGSACSSGKVEASHVLQAMGIADELAQSAIRVSLGWNSVENDVERFISVWNELRSRTSRSVSSTDQPVAKAG